MNQGPFHPPLDQLIRGFWHSRILFAGVELGIFDCLSQGPRTAGQVARELQLDERGTRILLEALTALGLLYRHEDRYENNREYADALTATSPATHVDSIMHLLGMWHRWGELGNVVRTGHPAPRPEMEPGQQVDSTRHFIRAMHQVSRDSVQALVEQIDLGGVRRVLDVGGGPGSYCIALCQANPEIEAVLLDREGPLEVAGEYIEAAGLGDRIERRPGDALSSNYGAGYDLVLVSQLLHAYGPSDNATIVYKAAAALAPGGRLLINEFATGERAAEPAAAAIFAVNMLVNTQQGEAYSVEEIERWMREASLTDLRHEPLNNRSTLFIGTRRATEDV